MPDIAVTIVTPDADLCADWDDLVGRAGGNVFMHPAALRAAQAAGMADIRVLCAWAEDAGRRRLVGLWALQHKRPLPLGPAVLAAPPYEYSFVANPVIDPDIAEAAVAALFAAIDRERSLPKVVRLRYLDADAPSYPAIMSALAARGAATLKLSERPRPFATRDIGLKRSGSTRKKLRQDFNRLAALGTVDIVNERTLGGVQQAFENFLALEAAGWKGANGTAIACDEDDAAFARQMISGLAAAGNASVAQLRLDGRTIAAQVLLYCGTTAYTWKIAFDAEFGKFSPGALLVDRISEQLFAVGGITAIESCSPEGGFMNQIWDGRRDTVDLLLDVGASRSLPFLAVSIGERARRLLRGFRDHLRERLMEARRRRTALAR